MVSLVQFAYCARKIIFGQNVIVQMMNGKIFAILLANDISDTQKKKYQDKALFYQVPVIDFLSKKEIALLFGKNEVACIGITDKGMAHQLIELNQLE